ncbi:MAG: hypothetical protein U0Y82_11645 [Thermoleophilia bacterium]
MSRTASRRSHLILAAASLTIALGASGYAAASYGTQPATSPATAAPRTPYAVSSHGVHFFNAGQQVRLGKAGHFTFVAGCKKVNGGNQVTIAVVADTLAGLDGNAPAPAGTLAVIHQNSDALDSTPDKPLNNGDFDQVASASSSTEIAQDGQEVDIFYTDGVNGFGHDCFAGYTGVRG